MSVNALSPWRVSQDDFPQHGNIEEKLRFLLGYAILAPSSHNSQPWLFRVRQDRIELRADRARQLAVADPHGRELTISCGAALFNLRLAMRQFGWEDKVSVLPDRNDPDLLAVVHPGEKYSATVEDSELFAAIPIRHTNRAEFDRRAFPESIVQKLQHAATAEGAWLHRAEGADTRLQIARLVAEGDLEQGRNKKFRQELSEWVRSNTDGRGDGIPAYAYKRGGLGVSATSFFIRWLDWGESQAEEDVRLLSGSPVLAILGTLEDTPAAWLRAGQATQRVLLELRAAGAWASFLSQAVQEPALRTRLREAVAEVGYPHLLLRMGFGPSVQATPRRGVEEVLLDTVPTPRQQVSSEIPPGIASSEIPKSA